MLSPSRRWSRTAALVTVLGVLLALFGMVPAASAAPGDYTITGESKNEGTGGTTVFTFTVSVEGPYVGQVDYTVNSGTAKAGEDFVDPGPGTLTFVGQSSQTINVTVNADAFPEPNETFSVTLSNPFPGSCASSCTAEATIINDDAAAAVASVSSPTVAEDAEDGTADFLITLDKAPVTGQTITVDYTTSEGTAFDPEDFDGGTGSVTFAATETEKTIAIPIVDDALDEVDETFTLTITPSNANCTTCTGTATITDDDDAPTISIADLEQFEGNTGVTSFDFVVTLSGPSGRTITVDYATIEGDEDTATPGVDYVVTTGTVEFKAGDTAKSARVGVVSDLSNEAPEKFTVQLSSPVQATIADGVAVGTIKNDDGQPSLRINDVVVTEGSTGTTDATFNVDLSRASGLPVTVNYATAEGSATDPEDYASRSGTLTFEPGEVRKTITVPVVGDAFDEPNETFTVTLSGSANATIADATGLGTINDDDATPTLSVNDVAAAEGDTDGTPAGTDATFTITLSAPSNQEVTVTYQTANGTATAGTDYTAVGPLQVTFNPGDTTKQVEVNVLPDDTDEPDETFTLTLSNPSNATLADASGTGTITDDDAGPTFSITDAFVTEIDAAGATLNFTVTKAGATSETITVPFATEDGSATAPADYTAQSGSLVFAPGDTTKTITVQVAGDNISEPTETMFVRLSAPTPSGTLTDAVGTGTIQDDENNPPSVSIADASTTEGTGGTKNLTFTVTRSASPPGNAGEVKVFYETQDGTAKAGSDYTATSGFVTIPANQTTATIDVPLVTDSVDEPNETFTVVLLRAENANISDASATGTITDDDNAPVISANAPTVLEGTGDAVNLIFTVSLTNGSSSNVTVNYATSDGTATEGRDYTGRSGTLTFTPGGPLSQDVVISVNGDAISEADETVLLTLSGASGGTIGGTNPATGTITDDDAEPTISVADVTVDEGDAGSTGADFVITLSAASEQTITVTANTADGTATAPGDYSAVADELVTFAAGEVSKTVTVDVAGDTVDEADETFDLELTGATNASIADDTATATITDDDDAPVLSIGDVTVTEGDDGTVDAIFTITKTGATEQEVTVTVDTADGTASAPGDYTAIAGEIVTFAPADDTETVTVAVEGDTIDEALETFSVVLRDAGNASIAEDGGTGTGSISDDDAAPVVSIGDATVTEGDDGTVDATFTITKTGATERTVTVQATTADATATAPGDYTALDGVEVSFAPAEATKTVTVLVAGDEIDEVDETFTVTLDGVANGSVAEDGGTGTGTITDDDDASVTLAIDDVSVDEGDADTTDATFTITKTGTTEQTVTVTVDTTDGTATTPGDYAAIEGLEVTFAPGETTKEVTVDINGDTLDEPNETFTVALSGATNAAVSDASGTGTITDDDDATATLAIDDVTVDEGDAGTTDATFTITKTGTTGQTVTVVVDTADGTATAPGDYAAIDGLEVTFAPADTTKTVTVAVNGDGVDEVDETFTVALSNPSHASITDGTGTGTINDDDAGDPVTFTVADVSVAEGNSGTVNAVFTVTRNGSSTSAASVVADTADGTATAPGDYTAVVDQLVSFAIGESTKTVTVAVKGDALDEVDETFTLVLSEATGGTIADGTATGTITDDDPTPSLSVADVTVAEGNTGTTPASFVVTLSAASGRTVTVNYTTANGTATGTDYTATSGVLTFSPGQTTKTVVVSVKGDTADEANETFTLVLSSPAGATLADGSATGTITDDDEPAAQPVTPEPGQGYSLVGEDGSLYAYGTAKNLGDMKGTTLNAPVIGVAYTPGGNGYWLVARDGGIFTFGDAEFFGSMGDKKLNAPVINMEPLASGNGYWLVAADGGIFTFGQAEFFGSMGASKLNQPVFDMTSTDTDKGYWLVARDGGIFSFGDAETKFYGNPVNDTNPRPTRIIGMDSSPGSLGYWIADANGKVWNFGNAEALGDRYLAANPAPMIGFASVPGVKP